MEISRRGRSIWFRDATGLKKFWINRWSKVDACTRSVQLHCYFYAIRIEMHTLNSISCSVIFY